VTESGDESNSFLSELVEKELIGGVDPGFAETYFRDTPESFLAWCHLCGCDRMYRSDIYDNFYNTINSNYPRILILMSRGTYKSTALCAKVARDIARDRNERIAYFSETLDQAKKYVGWVRNQFEDNRRIIQACGTFKPRRGKKKWSDQELWVVGRTDLSKREATLTARGLNQVRAGPHYGKIIIDDPCSVGNTRTANALNQTIEYIKLLFAIAESVVDIQTQLRTSMTQIIVSCTRYHDDDALGYILDINDSLKKRHAAGDETAIPWKVIEVPAVDEDGKPNFAHLPLDVLAQLKDEMLSAYAPQYMLNPIPPDKQLFVRPMFQVIPEPQLPKLDQMHRYLLTDTATTKNEDSDDVALGVVGRDATGRDFVLDLVMRPMKPSEVVDEMFRLYFQWVCRWALMEKIAINDVYGAMIEQKCITDQMRLKVVPVTGRTMESKKDRIASLEIPYSGKRIYYSSRIRSDLIRVNPADGLCYGRIVDQHLKFPKSKDDHWPDALSDLYKRAPDMSPLCPRPRPNEVLGSKRPATVNGRFVNVNPQVKPGPSDFWGQLGSQVKGQQLGGPYGSRR
jgi:hypothetical protein